jgi:hypothetical protein
MVVTFYETARGDRPVEEYLDELLVKEAAKVLDVLAATEVRGLDATVTRHIRGKLWEIKVSASRIFYVLVTGPEVVLLHAMPTGSSARRRRRRRSRRPSGGWRKFSRRGVDDGSPEAKNDQ